MPTTMVNELELDLLATTKTYTVSSANSDTLFAKNDLVPNPQTEQSETSKANLSLSSPALECN